MVSFLASINAQDNLLKGFIYDKSNGASMPLVTILLDGTSRGAVSDENGYFAISRLEDGNYTVTFSFIGYDTQEIRVELTGDVSKSVMIYLIPSKIELEEATIYAVRKRWEKSNPISIHRLSQKTISRIPSIGGQPDLAQFLQMIPGIIYTGDKGGQFYIRGGAPIHNKTLIDGLTIISPFHSLGFISVFETDILKSVDVYTAGFNAQHGGRLSSIIDMKTIDGNRTELKGKLSASTFGYNLLLHGPIVKMTPEDPVSLSLLFSNKSSYIDKLAPKLYPYVDSMGLPFNYNDVYLKVSLIGRKGDQVNVFGIKSNDKARYSDVLNTEWQNTAGGIEAKLVPSASEYMLIGNVSISDFKKTYMEELSLPRSTRYNSYQANIGTQSYLPNFEFRWAVGIEGYTTNHSFVDLNNIHQSKSSYTNNLLVYAQPKILRGKWIIEPGLHFHYYGAHLHLSPEPRLQLKYNLNDNWSLNFAGGKYSQDLSAVNSENDVLNIFQGYYTGVDFAQTFFLGKEVPNFVQKAWHAVGGIAWLSDNNIKFTAEAYLKDFYRLLEYNRNKIYDDTETYSDIIEYFKKYFIIESGLAYGFDLLIDWQYKWFALWSGYSFSKTNRRDEFTTFYPNFDRRHNLNLSASASFKNKLDIKVRWNLSSGLPFTQSLGYYHELELMSSGLMLDPDETGKLVPLFSSYNEGRLPWYHRLDISMSKSWTIYKDVEMELNAGVLNVYNRRNVFFLDRMTQERIDQMPILPTVGIKISF